MYFFKEVAKEFGYDKDVPPPAWEISDQAILYLPEEAKRLDIRIKGKWKPPIDDGGGGFRGDPGLETCPVCGNPIENCTCGEEIPSGVPQKISGEGPVAQAFQQLLDKCQQHSIDKLCQVFIRIEGAGKQGALSSRALGLAIPQFGKGQFFIEQEVTADFTSGEKKEWFKQEFSGTWNRYKRIKNIVDAFGAEAAQFSVKMRLGADFEDGMEVNGDQFLGMRDVLSALEVGRVSVEGVPFREEE